MRDYLGIAGRQLGLVTRGQLLGSGLTDRRIMRLVAEGHLSRIHSGVYAVAGAPATLHQRALAACLSAGPPVACSHRCAAALHGLVDGVERIEVSVPVDRRVRGPGFVVHRSTLLRPRDVTKLGPVPVTSAPRTLVDTSGVLSARDRVIAVDRALRSGRLSPRRLVSVVEDSAFDRRAGIAELRALARDRLDGGVPESELETLMLLLLERWRLPSPERQFEVRADGRPHRFDLAYPQARVGIELDGRAPHSGAEAFRADRRRANRLVLKEWAILRFTWWDVTEDEGYVVATVSRALGLRPGTWRRVRGPAVGA